MPKYEIDHIHLTSPNPLETAKLYESLFGAIIEEVTERYIGGAVVTLNLNGVKIVFTTNVPITPRKVELQSTNASSYPEYGLQHIALRTDNLSDSVKEMKVNGFFGDEIHDAGKGVKLCRLWVKENVLIEFIERSEV